MKEIWKKVPRHHGWYMVSSRGRVKSVGRLVPNPASRTGYGLLRERIMKLSVNDDGYASVGLYRKGEGKNVLVSYRINRLVASVFIPNPDDKPEVNHMDGNKLNNRMDNLEWATLAENKKHASENGFVSRSFSDAQLIAVARLRKKGFSYRAIAEKVGGTDDAVCNVCTSRSGYAVSLFKRMGIDWESLSNVDQVDTPNAKKYTSKDVASILARRRRGDTFQSIADDYNSYPGDIRNVCLGKLGYIYRIMKREGIAPIEIGEEHHRFTTDEILKIVSLRVKGKTLQSIADRFDTTPSEIQDVCMAKKKYVASVLSAHGINPIRTRKDEITALQAENAKLRRIIARLKKR